MSFIKIKQASGYNWFININFIKDFGVFDENEILINFSSGETIIAVDSLEDFTEKIKFHTNYFDREEYKVAMEKRLNEMTESEIIIEKSEAELKSEMLMDSMNQFLSLASQSLKATTVINSIESKYLNYFFSYMGEPANFSTIAFEDSDEIIGNIKSVFSEKIYNNIYIPKTTPFFRDEQLKQPI